MWKIARTLFDIAHALMRLAIEIVELDRRERQNMTDAISELEGAQDARDTTDADLQAALAAELDRVKVDTQHLIDEIGAGAGNTDPARLMRVAQRIADSNARVRAVVDQLNSEDPVPDFPAAPSMPPAANDGGAPATTAPTTPSEAPSA